ncbi:MAG: phospholipase [Actinomycetota bacterium]|nr:phospholipase [Actinomycetota bacterium]
MHRNRWCVLGLALGLLVAGTVMIVTYDEWGGFYDHVVPPRVTPGVPLGAEPASGPDRDVVDGRVLLGFRVPCIVASPLARGMDPTGPRVDHRLYDHTSILRLIEWRWGLRPLGQRDASTRPADPANLAARPPSRRGGFVGPEAIPSPQPPPPRLVPLRSGGRRYLDADPRVSRSHRLGTATVDLSSSTAGTATEGTGGRKGQGPGGRAPTVVQSAQSLREIPALRRTSAGTPRERQAAWVMPFRCP